MKSRLLVKLVLVTFLAYLFLSCATKPEPPVEKPEPEKVTEAPAEKPAPPEKPEEKPEEPAPPEKPEVEPVKDSEIRLVESAIDRAREADAGYYEPDNLSRAEAELQEARTLRSSDPESAREHLAKAKKLADRAFESSVAKAAKDLRDRLQRMEKQLRSIEADRFMPEEFVAAVAKAREADRLFEQEKLAAAREQAYGALADMANLYENLTERQRWVRILKRDINQYLRQAEELNAHIRAPQEFERVNQLYLQGIEAYQGYDLFKAEEDLGSAREAALALIQTTQQAAAEERQKSRKLMMEVMQELEEASELTVVTEEGRVIEPEPWSGEELVPEEAKEESESEPHSFLLPDAEDRHAGGEVAGGEAAFQQTVVLGDIEEEDLLTQAKELWKKGVEVWKEGDYLQAEEYFNESRRLTEAYKTQAVNPDYPIYVVRLIPERRDCLWRIAEYDFIYSNPYLWPKIWRRNRKLIQHPDLIYPGWKLVIPPE